MIVAHAGSIGPLLADLAPRFEAANGTPDQLVSGEGGSVGLARALADDRLAADVFVPADAAVNRLVLGDGPGRRLDCCVVFSRTSRVLAYSPKSRWADRLAGGDDWPDVLLEPGLRLGRSDPDRDPGGYYAVLGLRAAEDYYARPGLARAVLGDDRNPAQVLEPGVLYPGLKSGEVDVGFLYRNGAVERGLPYLELPPEINFGDPDLADHYARYRYETAAGEVFTGTPVYYTAGILRDCPRPEAAAEFIRYLLSDDARAVMREHGLLDTPVFGIGDLSRLPPTLAGLVSTPLPGWEAILTT